MVRRVQQRLDAEHGAVPAWSVEVVRLRARLYAEELVLEPGASVLAGQSVQCQAAAGELAQFVGAQIRNDPQATAGAPAIEQYRVKDTELSNPVFLLAPRVVVPAGHVDDVNSSKDGSSA